MVLYKNKLINHIKNPTYFLVLWAVLVLLKLSPIVRQYTSPLFYLLIIYGMFIIFYDIFKEKKVLKNKYTTLIFLFLFFIGLSTLVNYDNGFAENAKTLALIVMHFAIMARANLDESRDEIVSRMHLINAVIVIFVTIASIISIYLFIRGIKGHYTIYIGDADLEESIYYYGTSHHNRLVGIFTNPNSVGAYCSIAVLCAINNLNLKYNNLKTKGLYYLSIAINFISITLSDSRGALLALLCSIFTIIFFKLLFLFQKDGYVITRLAKSFIPAMISIILIYGFLNVMEQQIRKLPSFFSNTKEGIVLDRERQKISSETDIIKSSNGRFLIWEIGLNTAKKHPIFGVGKARLYDKVAENWEGGTVPSAMKSGLHNIFIETLVAYGTPTLILILLIIGSISLDSLKKMKQFLFDKYSYSLILYALGMVVFLVVNNMFESIMLYRVNLATYIFTLYLGMLMYLIQLNNLESYTNIIYRFVIKLENYLKTSLALDRGRIK